MNNVKVKYDSITGELGKAYPETMNIPEPFIVISIDEMNNIASKTDKIGVVKNGEITYISKIEKEREKYFKFNFFQSSLGWIRRKPVMKDGSVKDFLNDCLPVIKLGLTDAGLPKGAIIRYSEPDYTNEITEDYMKTLQNDSAITLSEAAQFIEECVMQFLADFKGV